MDQMRTDIGLKLADIALRQQQLRWEPLKIVAASMPAEAALMGAAVALVVAWMRHIV